MTQLSKQTSRIFSMLGTCGVFGTAMCDLAEEEPDLAVVTADLCFYSGLERFKTAHPDMLYNVGIAEQNLVGVACGLAKEGFNTYATTYASFAATRALDQVRVGMGYMQLPLKLIGLTSGFSVGILGATHISIEDIAIMRSIPNIIILSPADGFETYKAIMEASRIDRPVYIRLTGTMNNPVVYREDYEFSIGKVVPLKEDGDIAVIATGTMVYQAQKAVELLQNMNINCRLYDMHTIKPADERFIRKLAAEVKAIITVEEHSVRGGLGSVISEVLAQMRHKPPQCMIGAADEYCHAASYEYLLDKYGLTAGQIADKVIKFMREEGE